MTTITQVITALPTAPDPATMTPAVFSTTAAASVLAQKAMTPEINTWAGQANTVAGEVNANRVLAETGATTATTKAAEASASASAAQSASNATLWVSGQAYVTGNVVYSPINFLSYRAKSNTSGTTDPSLASGVWAALNLTTAGSAMQTFLNTPSSANFAAAITDESGGAGAVLFSNSPTIVDPIITGTVLEDVYTITDGAAFEINPSNGSIQLITLGASRTPKATSLLAGESVTLMVDDGTAYALTWTDATWGGSGVVWKTNTGTAPTLNTTGYTVIQLWKVGSLTYGARVGDA